MTDTSKEAVDRVIAGLRPMNGCNEMDAAVAMLDALAKERDELKADIVRDRARLLAEVERLRNLARRAKTWFDPYSPDRGQWLHDYKTCMQGKEGNE